MEPLNSQLKGRLSAMSADTIRVLDHLIDDWLVSSPIGPVLVERMGAGIEVREAIKVLLDQGLLVVSGGFDEEQITFNLSAVGGLAAAILRARAEQNFRGRTVQ